MSRDRDFEDLRGYLFSLAYRMLGSVGDAEDVVQETYLRWQKAPADVESPKAFLSKVATRLCIDQLRSARSRRESYVGPWLPEPVATEEIPGPEDAAERADSLSLAFLVVLESLNPTERAVFLLREIFEYDYSEIADIVGLTEANCRQVAHRAKQHIASRRPRFTASQEKRDELLYRFLGASGMGDISGLVELLADDVAVFSDGGGRAKAARRPIRGPEKVARFLLGIIKKADPSLVTRIIDINGQSAIALFEGDALSTVVALDVDEESIRNVHILVNPDKLERLGSRVR